MQVQTQSRPDRVPAAATARPAAAASDAGPLAGSPPGGRAAPGGAGPLARALAVSVFARASARGRGEVLLQRAIEFLPVRAGSPVAKKYLEAAAEWEVARKACVAMRDTVATHPPPVTAWLDGELKKLEPVIAEYDGKGVPASKHALMLSTINEFVADLAKVRKALPVKLREETERQRLAEIDRAGRIETRIASSEQQLAGLEGFLDISQLEAIMASAGTGREALKSARTLLGAASGLVEGAGKLGEAESATAAIEGIVAGGALRKEFATRRDAVRSALEALQRPRPKARITELLPKLDELSPEQQIASLTDVSVAGGMAALENELKAAQEVDASLTAFRDGAEPLAKKSKLFATWAVAEFDKLKALTWEQLVVSNGDPSADPGLKRLLKGVEHAKLAVPRLKVIGDDIDKLKPDPLKAHLDAMWRKVSATWTAQVADLAALETALKFAQEVEQRRKDAVAALPGLTHQTQRANIEGWLRDNEALTFAEQQDGVANTRLMGGLKNIEARIAMYNEGFRRDREAAVRAEQDRVARAEAERLRKAAEKAATSRLLTAGDASAVLVDLHSRAEIWQGAITETYKSSYDAGLGEFSAEVRIGGLKDIVIHAHCAADGRPKPGNAVHWKELRYKHLTGPTYSHPVPDSVRPYLLDATKMKGNRDANSKINWR